MAIVGSMVIYPPPGPLVFIVFGLVLVCGVALGGYLASRKDADGLRRLATVFLWLGVGGCLVLQAWAAQVAWGWLDPFPYAGPVSMILRFLAYPLHASAAGMAWLLCAGLFVTMLGQWRQGRRTGTALCMVLLAALLLPPVLGRPQETYGFRTHGADQAEDMAKGFYGGDTWSGLMEMHPEVFFVVRWMPVLDVVAPLLGALAAYAFLRWIRRVREVLPNLDAPIGVRPVVLLFLAATVAWGLTRVLSVAQAQMWASPRTPPGMIEEALRGELAVPVAALLLGILMGAMLVVRRVRLGPTEATPAMG